MPDVTLNELQYIHIQVVTLYRSLDTARAVFVWGRFYLRMKWLPLKKSTLDHGWIMFEEYMQSFIFKIVTNSLFRL